MKKYIKLENIEKFRLSMIDPKNIGSVPEPRPYEDYTITGKKKRLVLSSSTKWSHVDGVEHCQVTGLYLAPSLSIEGLNTCKASGACTSGCIAFTGMLGMHQQQTIQLRTLALYHHTERYLSDIVMSIYQACFIGACDGLETYIRLNGTSDLDFSSVLDFEAMKRDFIGLGGFYDYTKFTNRYRLNSSAYHVTFSVSEKTKKLPSGFDRFAFVVSERDKKHLLGSYDMFVDGDLHDIRALDKNKFVLLKAKRPTKKGQSIDTEFICSIDRVLSLCGVEVKQ
jgi:hypothetical protein